MNFTSAISAAKRSGCLAGTLQLDSTKAAVSLPISFSLSHSLSLCLSALTFSAIMSRSRWDGLLLSFYSPSNLLADPQMRRLAALTAPKTSLNPLLWKRTGHRGQRLAVNLSGSHIPPTQESRSSAAEGWVAVGNAAGCAALSREL